MVAGNPLFVGREILLPSCRKLPPAFWERDETKLSLANWATDGTGRERIEISTVLFSESALHGVRQLDAVADAAIHPDLTSPTRCRQLNSELQQHDWDECW